MAGHQHRSRQAPQPERAFQPPVANEVVLAELRDVLSRKGRLPAQQIEAIEMLLREHPVAPSPVQTLELGLVDADLVVTGDPGVLACSTPPLPLVTPRGCWEQLRGAG